MDRNGQTQYCSFMLTMEETERRRSPRTPASFRVVVQEFPTSAISGATGIEGEIRNLSRSGMCLLLDKACNVSALLRCEVLLSNSCGSIPTLAYVRWSRNHADSNYLAGMEFLL